MEQTPRIGCASDSDDPGAEPVLPASERRLRALLANAFDGIAVLDASGLLTFASPPLCAILGKEEHEVLGLPGLSFVDALDAAEMRSLVLASEPGDRIGPIGLRIRVAEGTWRPFEGYRTDLTEDPDIRGVVWNLRDMSETRQAALALSRSEERLQALATGSSDVTVVNAMEGFAIYAGPSMERVCSVTAVRSSSGARMTRSSILTIWPTMSLPPPRPCRPDVPPGRHSTDCATTTGPGAGYTPVSPTSTTIRRSGGSWPTSATSPMRRRPTWR